jgi:hypothetical protein
MTDKGQPPAEGVRVAAIGSSAALERRSQGVRVGPLGLKGKEPRPLRQEDLQSVEALDHQAWKFGGRGDLKVTGIHPADRAYANTVAASSFPVLSALESRCRQP